MNWVVKEHNIKTSYGINININSQTIFKTAKFLTPNIFNMLKKNKTWNKKISRCILNTPQ